MKGIIVLTLLAVIFIAILIGIDEVGEYSNNACSWACEKIEGSKPTKANWNVEKNKCDCEWSYSHPNSQ